MAYYLIFDEDNKLRGYTQDKDVILEFQEQRPEQTWNIQKVEDNFFNKKAKKYLHESHLELSDYYGVHLLVSECDDIFMDSNSVFGHIYDILENFEHALRFLKLSEKEIEIVGRFALKAIELRDKLEEGFYHVGKQDEFDECLHVKDIVLNILNKRIDEHVISHFQRWEI